MAKYTTISGCWTYKNQARINLESYSLVVSFTALKAAMQAAARKYTILYNNGLLGPSSRANSVIDLYGDYM